MSEHDFRPVDPDEVPAEDNPTRSPETPEADAAEQRRDVVESSGDEPVDLPFGVDPADAAEQQREVDFDEDDYR